MINWIDEHKKDCGWVNSYQRDGTITISEAFAMWKVVECEAVLTPSILTVQELLVSKAKAEKEKEVVDPDKKKADELLDEYTI